VLDELACQVSKPLKAATASTARNTGLGRTLARAGLPYG
jgi:hypothetical protein